MSIFAPIAQRTKAPIIFIYFELMLVFFPISKPAQDMKNVTTPIASAGAKIGVFSKPMLMPTTSASMLVAIESKKIFLLLNDAQSSFFDEDKNIFPPTMNKSSAAIQWSNVVI
jgi:hypothetical protein